MSTNPRGFREELAAMERINPDLNLKYWEELDKMFNEEIKGAKKFGWLTRDLFLLLFGAALLTSALFNQPVALPTIGRLLWGLSGLFTIGVALLGLRLIAKKRMDLRKDQNFIARFGGAGLLVVAFTLLAVGFLNGNLQDFAFLAPMALLIIALAILIGIDNRVQQAELNTREKLLEIEYRLVALDERLHQGGSPQS